MNKLAILFMLLLTPSFARSSQIQAQCESFDGNSFLGVFAEPLGDFSASTSGRLDLGRTEIRAEEKQITLLPEMYWESIIIPRGKSEIQIGTGDFHCSY
jgi:hypothetical protein